MPDTTPRCILVLDNEPSMRDALHAMIAALGLPCEVVARPDDIHARAAEADLLICDLHDPRGGAGLVRDVLAHDADLPVILVAQQPEVDDVVEALRAGAFDFLRWPIPDRGILARAVQRAVEARSLRNENRRYREQLEAANADLQLSLRLLREDEEAGRRVQMRILPETPLDLGWCRVEHRIVPSLYLSGDFIDYFEVGEKQLGFYLADVSGHGVSSAFVTMFLKTIGNRARRDLRRDNANRLRPSLVLHMANRELLRLGLGKHVTLFCGVIDFSTRQLHYSVAGQYPQPIVFDGKCAQYLNARGMPVGLFDGAVYEDRMHALPQGFALVLLSDGALELMGDMSLADKEARLLDIVGGGGVTVDALGRALQLDVEREIPDDVALLVIRDAAAGTHVENT
jgi:sigma-B regulation protein RsbU (phosphoserine phosphatase)